MYPKVARYFKKVIPHSLSIKKCKVPKGLEGDCTYFKGTYYIRVNKNLNDLESINCLLHELSHVETMFEQQDPHGHAFGKAYSKIYKLYEKEFT